MKLRPLSGASEDWPIDDEITVLTATRCHFIVRWDEGLQRYTCDCGHTSPTATDHERHESEDQRRQAREGVA